MSTKYIFVTGGVVPSEKGLSQQVLVACSKIVD